jgi:hypothetical protein
VVLSTVANALRAIEVVVVLELVFSRSMAVLVATDGEVALIEYFMVAAVVVTTVASALAPV